MRTQLIRLENVSKSYYTPSAVTQALRKINLSFCEGEFVAITGESGGGKSTLLSIMGGLLTFDDGEMYVEGEATFPYDERDWEEYRKNKIGFVFQDYSLIGHYTVLDNVAAAMIVMGEEPDRAREKALSYLEKVGLGAYVTHSASELSSGQKQRLSIARALAKETKIILADEPTGNLDSETGEQIVALLAELSKERLIIMVTHNIDQALKYVNRQIKLNDGEVVLDLPVTDSISSKNITEKMYDKKETNDRKAAAPKKREGKQKSAAAFFARLNRQTQRGRGFMFTIFFLCISLASFLFIGELCLHADDNETMNYSKRAFRNGDATRLVVRNAGGRALEEADREKLGNICYVTGVDTCDLSNDINYYMEEGTDYSFRYGVQRDWYSKEEVKTVEFLVDNNFVRSTDLLSNKKFLAGTMPTNRSEIVVTSDDISQVGKTVEIYFRAMNIWDSDTEYYVHTFTISGVVEGSDKQVYFDPKMCRMLSMNEDSGVWRIYYNWSEKSLRYENSPKLVPVMADDLSGKDIRLSQKAEALAVGTAPFTYEETYPADDSYGQTVEDKISIRNELHSSTGIFMEVSEELFNTYYDREVFQYSLYVISYAKVDAVIHEVEKMGYEVVSPYRTGNTEYNEILVQERLTLLGICVIALLVLFVADIFIVSMLMRIKIKDYEVHKSIGMDMEQLKEISLREMAVYLVTAMVITVVVMQLLRFLPIAVVPDMMWYFSFGSYLFYVFYQILAGLCAVELFHRGLKRRIAS